MHTPMPTKQIYPLSVRGRTSRALPQTVSRLAGAYDMRLRLPDEATPAKGIAIAYRTVVHLLWLARIDPERPGAVLMPLAAPHGGAAGLT